MINKHFSFQTKNLYTYYSSGIVMDPQEIINFHLTKQKNSEEEPDKICEKCKSPMTKGSVRISGNAKYQEWQCTKCSHEMCDLLGLAE
jgi:hypothetical protein